MRQWLHRIYRHEKTPLALAFLVPFLVLAVLCIIRGIYPFGTRSFMAVDMYHQYAPFLTEFAGQLKGGGSLSYTWNLGLGTDMVSLMAYYLSSPVNWLVYFCPVSHVIEFMTLLILMKTGLCGWSFAFYLRRHYSDKGYRPFLFSVFYALSGFMCAYSWNIMWLDTVWLTPLVILGLERLVRQGKPMLYTITLAVSILSNYYISILLCVFLVLYFAVLFLEQKGHRIAAVFRFGWYSLLAGGMGAVLILPEIAALSGSASGSGGFPEKIEWYFSAIEGLARACIGVKPVYTTDHWPNLYCGCGILLLLVLYVCNRRIGWRRKLPRLLLVVFFLVSFANNYLDFIWHGLHFPIGLPARQTFLYVFLLLILGYEVLRYFGGNAVWHIVLALAVSEGFVFVCFLCTDRELVTGESLLLTAIFLLGYGGMLICRKAGNLRMRKVIGWCAMILVVEEAAVNLEMTGVNTSNRASYMEHQEAYRELTAGVREQEHGFYRIDKWNRLTKNDSALADYPSATIFSSLINHDVADFYRELGMEGGKNYYCYSGATALTSSMLSVKYLMTDSGAEESPYRRLVGEQDGIYIYENLYTLPLGYVVDEDLEDRWDFTEGTPAYAQNGLALALGASGQLLIPVKAAVEKDQTVIHVEESGCIYGYYRSKDADAISAKINDKTRTYSKCAHIYLLDFGYCEAGTDIVITAEGAESFDVQGYRLNDQVFGEVYDALSEQTMMLTEWTDTSIAGEIDMERRGRLVLTVPDDPGWQLAVDGKPVEYTDFCGAFISVVLPEGHHSIELHYTTPYLELGAGISGGCLAVFLVLMSARYALEKRKRTRFV